MSEPKRGIVKQILKDHFDGFWKLHSERFSETYRNDIKETVEKTIMCGTKDLGYARYECVFCEDKLYPVQSVLPVKVGSVISAEKSKRMIGLTNNRTRSISKAIDDVYFNHLQKSYERGNNERQTELKDALSTKVKLFPLLPKRVFLIMKNSVTIYQEGS